MYIYLSRLSSRDAYQRLPRHRLWLGDAEEVESSGGDVGEDALVAEVEALGGDDQGDRVEGVGGVGGAVGLEHVVAVAVVGGDDAGAAPGGDGGGEPCEVGGHRFQGLGRGGGGGRGGPPVRGWGS